METKRSVPRLIAGVVLGIVAAIIVMNAVQWVGFQFFPLPAGLNLGNPAEIVRTLAGMEPGAISFTLLAWFLGALLGSIVAVGLARQSVAAWPVALLIAVCVVYIGAAAGLSPLLIAGGVILPLLAALLVARRAR